jgi:hypothetical protein
MNRRDFLRSSSAVVAGLGMPQDLFAQPVPAARGANVASWDAGSVAHILPQVSDTRMLVKVSLRVPLASEPILDINGTTVRGRMTDTHGEHWQFYASDLKPNQRYTLSLRSGSGAALCEPWELATFRFARSARRRCAFCFLPVLADMRVLAFCRVQYAIGCFGAP